MKKHKLLFGTGNVAKLERIRSIVKDLPLEVLGLEELNIQIEVEENGTDVHENALKKARAYYEHSGLPTFSIDSALYIDQFPEDKQPGLFVRRINGRRATDEEMIEYYARELEKVGGESKGQWISSIGFVFNDRHSETYELIEERFFTSKVSPVRKEGWPLGSIAIDLTFNKYAAEITLDEREMLQEKADQELYDIFMKVSQKL